MHRRTRPLISGLVGLLLGSLLVATPQAQTFSAQIQRAIALLKASANTWTGAQTITIAGIATTSTDGWVVANDTASTAGVPVQQSPRGRFRSHVWNTTAVAADNTNDWWVESVPVSGTTPSGLLKFGSSLNGAAATYPLTVGSSGTLSLGTNPALAGVINIPNNTVIMGRNAANSADVQMMTVNSSNVVQVSPAGAPTQIQGSLNLIGALNFAGAAHVLFSATAPTIASGGCTSPAVTSSNGTAAFLLTLGSSCSGVKTIILTMPSASSFWHVSCDNNTSDAQQAANYPVARATSTTAVTITNYGRVLGTQADYTASDTLLCSALAE